MQLIPQDGVAISVRLGGDSRRSQGWNRRWPRFPGVRDTGACRKKGDEPGQTERPREQERDRCLSCCIRTERVREDTRKVDPNRTAYELEAKDQTERGTLQATMTRLGNEREE